MKEYSIIDDIDELIECLQMFYTEETEDGLKKLPKQLEKYSGIIQVVNKEAIELRNRVANELNK